MNSTQNEIHPLPDRAATIEVFLKQQENRATDVYCQGATTMVPCYLLCFAAITTAEQTPHSNVHGNFCPVTFKHCKQLNSRDNLLFHYK